MVPYAEHMPLHVSATPTPTSGDRTSTIFGLRSWVASVKEPIGDAIMRGPRCTATCEATAMPNGSSIKD